MAVDSQAVRSLRVAVQTRGLTISALSCQGNPLHPRAEVAGRHNDVLMKTLRLATELAVPVVNVFSGCPGAGDGSRYPCWIACAWPPDFLEVLEWQWRERLIPYWQTVAQDARRLGVSKLALEPMPGFMVYNPRTLLALRAEVGEEIGANLDPSHLFWQGIDPCAAVRELSGAIWHVHAKDTALQDWNVRRNGVLDTKPYGNLKPQYRRRISMQHVAEIIRAEIFKGLPAFAAQPP